MEKLKMHTKDMITENVETLEKMFPNCIVHFKDENGCDKKAVDFDLLKQELSDCVVEGNQERYCLSWPDKRKTILEANAPIAKTLRPCKDKSVNFNNTKNIYIEGDNLEVLKTIRETYMGKVKVVYIDPPYNTGNDIIYSNDYSIEDKDYFLRSNQIDESGNQMFQNNDTNGRFHTDWLNMMYARIKVSRDILTDDGLFLIAIDHNELFNLGEICDEIYGYTNRIGIISVVHKPEGRNQAKFIGPSNEFMLIYAKDESKAKLQKVVLDEEQAKLFTESDDKGFYRLKNFIRLSDGKYALRVNKPAFWYPIYVSQDLTKMSLEAFENATAVYPIIENGTERTWKTTSETFLERYNNGDLIAKKEKNGIVIYEKLREDQVIKTHWIDKKYHGFHFGTKILDDLLGVKTFDFPKSLYLMRDILKLTVGKNDIVLDFFSGSATTGHACMMLNAEDGGNRQFILVQMPAEIDEKSEAFKNGYKTICDIGEDRLRKAVEKIKEENRLLNPNIDLGFRVFKLDSSCMKDVYYSPSEISQNLLTQFEDNIKEDRSAEDLLFQVMLDMGVALSSEIKTLDIKGKKVFNVNDGNLVCCFDKNLTDDVVTEIAKMQPLYAVFRDASMSSDSVAVNFDQIFETYSPTTTRKII